MNLSQTAVDLAHLYQSAVVKPAALAEAHIAVISLTALKSTYTTVSSALGGHMPWWFIASLHYREDSSLSQHAYLGNGEHIIGTGRRSTLVPKGRGPFANFAQGAEDAIRHLNLQDSDDWSVGACLERAEIWNGLYYRRHHLVNPYLFSGTNLYKAGKFVADKHFDPHAVDKQLGVAVLYKAFGVVK